ncbi:hypothetical protein [Alkalimarinus coralli]|uniref:hypothetical protein n=1 Tax=Alkalimarinus coralli TaxID=2935863 RepID=UPI00202AC4A9|nr:hypothetical protein [Alkalimarinus coralli]
MQGGTTGIRVELPLLPKSSVETNGESSWRIVDALVDNLPGMMAANNASNTRVRFQDDWGDEDKFTEPMKRYPAASLELLLNGLYPLNAEFELMPVEKKLVGRNRGRAGIDLYEMKGNRAKVTVDLPYFIEGESVLDIQISIAQESDEVVKKGFPLLKFGNKKLLQIAKISSLPMFKEGAEEGVYKSHFEGRQALVVIRDFSKRSFSTLEGVDVDMKIDMECRVRLHVTSQDKPEKETIKMPWRGRSKWLDEPEIGDQYKGWLLMEDATILRS